MITYLRQFPCFFNSHLVILNILVASVTSINEHSQCAQAPHSHFITLWITFFYLSKKLRFEIRVSFFYLSVILFLKLEKLDRSRNGFGSYTWSIHLIHCILFIFVQITEIVNNIDNKWSLYNTKYCSDNDHIPAGISLGCYVTIANGSNSNHGQIKRCKFWTNGPCIWWSHKCLQFEEKKPPPNDKNDDCWRQYLCL